MPGPTFVFRLVGSKVYVSKLDNHLEGRSKILSKIHIEYILPRSKYSWLRLKDNDSFWVFLIINHINISVVLSFNIVDAKRTRIVVDQIRQRDIPQGNCVSDDLFDDCVKIFILLRVQIVDVTLYPRTYIR